MNPTDSSSVPSCRACASGGVAVNVTSGGAAGGPSPRSTTVPFSTRAHDRACSFLPAATTNSTSTITLTNAGEQVVLELAVGLAVVDERTGERVLLPWEHFADHVVGQPHPKPRRVDLRAVREQCLAPLVQVIADVDQRRELVLAVLVEAPLEPRHVRALLAALQVCLVQRLPSRDRPGHVVELQRLPRLTGVGIGLGV